jgi:hypothetical protein
VDSIEYRPFNRRSPLIAGWSGAAVGLIGIAGAATSAVVPGHATGILIVPGLVGLILATPMLSFAYSRTVLSAEGIQTRTFFKRHSCDWPDVTAIDTVEFSGRGSTYTQIIIRRASGEPFKLAAPVDSTSKHDPQFNSKLYEIRDYLAQNRPDDSGTGRLS